MSNIIIVGNGTSLLNKENGNLIDEFDDVVRFNSYKIKGFEKNVGIKSTIWFTCNKYHINDINDYKDVYVHSWQEDAAKCLIYQELNNIKPCIKISKELIKSIPISSPSTGLISIYYFLKIYNNVTITGFDWWDNIRHHYGDKEQRGTLHNPQKEFECINNLVYINKVKFL
jgi:hypothetical protein